MKILNISAHEGVYFHDGRNATTDQVEAHLSDLMFNSAPKNIGRALMRKGLVTSFEQWRLWGFPTKKFTFHRLPLWLFYSPDGEAMPDIERRLAQEGEPDIIWAEGIHFPKALAHIFGLCPKSLKIVYSKYCEPWLIERLEMYDMCLVDEEWQVVEMARRYPGVNCQVWDKLIDYEDEFFPTNAEKKFDICYVARLLRRKGHWLLFDALAKLKDRHLSVALVGSNDYACRQYLEPLAMESGVKAFFSGHVSTKRVNEIINESKMGVICDEYDAVPRAMLEYMAADVPVLVNSEMRAGTRYVGPKAGLVLPPAQFHEGVVEILENIGQFRPREHLIEKFSQDLVAEKMYSLLRKELPA